MGILDKKDYAHFFLQLSQFVEATCPILPESWNSICDMAQVYRLPKGIRLLDYMAVESCVRFLGQGMVKCEDHYSGRSFVYDFRVAPIILAETVSFFNGTPSRITLEAMTECVFIALPRDPFLALIKSNIDVSHFATTGVANYLGMIHYKQCLLRTLGAEERYKLFLKEFPQVARLGKLEDVASYINVTQPSLSRIRKYIVWEKDEEVLKALSNELDVLHRRM